MEGSYFGSEKTRLLEFTKSYLERGWRVVPIPLRKKRPVIKEWEKLDILALELGRHFNGRPQNVGVMLGDKSGGLVDIDLDSPEAVKLADFFLPKTSAVFGRKGKALSHRLYN